MATVTSGQNVISGLEKASQQHEVDLVIDLGVDRLIKWIGVYAILAVAVVAKISDYVGPNLSCYPAGNSSGYDGNFIEFAKTYCWESVTSYENAPVSMSSNTSQRCAFLNSNGENDLLKNPKNLKIFIHWLPYLMLLQAFVFALPSAYWHFRVGARLLGHIKFMQLMITDIFDKIKIIPLAFYEGTPYDEKSENFDGLRRWPKQKESSTQSPPASLGKPAINLNTTRASNNSNLSEGEPEDLHVIVVGKESSPLIRKRSTASHTNSVTEEVDTSKSGPVSPSDIELQPVSGSEQNNVIADPASDNPLKTQTESTLKNTQKSKDPTKQVFFLDWLLSGNMKDRHLFSMICYENFASMHHLPYILSVFNLQAFTPEGGFKDGVYEPEIDKQYPLTESLLYHWCHGKNFNNTFLVWNYALKHIFTAVSAFIMLAVMVWSAIILHDDMAASETFRMHRVDNGWLKRITETLEDINLTKQYFAKLSMHCAHSWPTFSTPKSSKRRCSSTKENV
uniref:uncharacterized protein LOC100186235 isoform X2 n=1 Tax=Ciona intestinalis TaxID=7719 RepID=UPI00089DCD8E|nr:uncharacterized protein LOC100186235 isoform X2 [Ciona intestinalis]|eukprot:XP_018667138.1 uncharacterized protein LOC100186235 isoform X2 [Ciona intestinalis]